MNNNSVLCNFINKHSNWQEEFEKLNIKFKIENNLAIFSYDIMADFSNPIVQEARGIIIDLPTLTVVCWPFRKFGNWQESYADDIDWSTARVQEKVDGSIIKCYWNYNQWCWATNNTINANNTIANNITNHTFMDIIKKAVNFNDIQYYNMDTNNTYIFELVSPENQIVVKYDEYKLYHTGTRNNVTGQELITDIGIERPKEYPLTTFEECIEAVNTLNTDNKNVEHEGFVVVDANWNRIKVKSLEYVTVHHLVTNQLSKKTIIEYILNSKDLSIIENYPQYTVYFMYYKYKLEELKFDIDRFLIKVRKLYEEYSYDRKAIALTIKNHKFATFGFKGLDNTLSATDMLANLTVNQLIKYIPDYQENEIIF